MTNNKIAELLVEIGFRRDLFEFNYIVDRILKEFEGVDNITTEMIRKSDAFHESEWLLYFEPMTNEEEKAVIAFFESGDFLPAYNEEPDDVDDMNQFFWDESFRCDEIKEMFRRSKLPETDPDHVYAYSVTEEDGCAWLESGLRYVNRIGYFFSRKKAVLEKEVIRYW